MLIPTYVVSKYKVFQGEINPMVSTESENKFGSKFNNRLLSILFVPFFKVATGLPPYVGMMLSQLRCYNWRIYNYLLPKPQIMYTIAPTPRTN